MKDLISKYQDAYEILLSAKNAIEDLKIPIETKNLDIAIDEVAKDINVLMYIFRNEKSD